MDAPQGTRSVKLGSYRGNETILLVEDQDLLRKVTADLLREQGYTVVEAGGSAAALKACSKLKGKVDLILTDIIMPGMSGLEMVQKMSKKFPARTLKTLFVSAYSEKKLSEYSFHEETVHFLEKPYTASELLTRLREILAV